MSHTRKFDCSPPEFMGLGASLVSVRPRMGALTRQPQVTARRCFILELPLLPHGLEIAFDFEFLALKKLFLASKSFPHSSFQRRELRLELEVGVVQLRMGEGGLGLQGAVVVPAEEDEQGRDEEDEAGGGAHRASCLLQPKLFR